MSPLSTCIRSSSTKWVVLNPFLMVFTPNSTARWLFATRGGPRKRTRLRYSRLLAPRLPRPLRQHRAGEGLLPRVLLVVQHRAPAWRHRPAHARAGPLRTRARGDPPQAASARRRLRRPPRPLRRGPAQRGGTRRGGLDQPAHPRQRCGWPGGGGGRQRCRRKGGLAKLVCEMSQNRWQVPSDLRERRAY